MKVSPLYLRHQLPLLATLGKVVLSSMRKPPSGMPVVPGPQVTDKVDPRPDDLIDLYLKWCGDSSGRYASTLPPHFFPQWGFPLMSSTLTELPFRMAGVLNQGCRVEVIKPLERGKPLLLNAQLANVEDDGFKARIHQKMTTGHSVGDVSLIAEQFAVVLLKKKKGGGKREPEDLSKFKEIGNWSAALHDGRNFGFLTGDMNPIHWIGPYAKLSGFKRQILHGYGSLSRSWPILEEKVGPIKVIDVRFTKPLVLPAKTRLLLKKTKKKGDLRLLDAQGNLCMAGTVEFA